ncbi:TniQ family protein [Nocardia vinacea]|uniref:TniQ family protein n=1 Tax=Nocardia vinacea TaxID=96468 RepID=UPI00340022DA
MSARTPPIRVPPLPGEAIDSWLEALAARHRASWQDMLDALGLTQPRSTVTGWIARPTPHEVTALAAATTCDPADIAAATLDRYHGTALRIDPATRKLTAFPWSPVSSSRFCPQCLAETGGRWQLRWRLAWSFACLHHHRLLADTCPDCRHRQRRLPLPGLAVPAPGRCASPLHGSTGIAPTRCGADLTHTETRRLDDGHPALQAQHRIDDIIGTGAAAFGVYAAAPMPGETALTDVKIIVDRVLDYATTASLAGVIPPDLLDAHSQVTDRADTHRPGKALPAAPTAALAVTAALAALGAPDAHQGGQALRWLITQTRHHRGKANSTTKTNASTLRRTDASPVLDAVQLAALAPSMSPSDQLRYRIASPFPTRPGPRADRAAALARSVPTMLWRAWSLPLTIPRPQQRQLRPAASVALLLTATTIPITDAAEILGGFTDNYRVNRALALLADCGHWDDVRQALTRMSDYLAEVGAPIDYQRRRSLDYTGLLPEHTWQRICRDTGAVALNSATAKRARCYLFERLSGMPNDASPAAVNDNHFHTRTADFVRRLTPQLARALDDHAREFLTTHGIGDEPPSWQPPTHLLHGLSLPGPDPADIDITRLHHLIRDTERTPGEAAEILGATPDTVRHLLEIHPAPLSPDTATNRSAYLTAKAALPPDTLADLYLHQRISTAEIAKRIGVDGSVIARLARDYQIPVRKPGRPSTTSVDRDWLHEQYITQGRTLTDLAHETGMTWSTMARWAQHHHIPLRRQHSYHNRANTPTATEIAAAPPLLQPTLAKTRGLGLLNDFATASNHPTLVFAAATIGIHPKTLTARIKELEQNLGGPLLNRTHNPRQPMTPTPLGHAVLDAINRFKR